MGLSLPFVTLLIMMAVLPQWAPHRWARHYQKYIITLVVLTLGCASFLDISLMPRFLCTLYSEYIPFILFLGCLYGLSCGIQIRITAPPLPKWNTFSLFLGMLTAALLGTTGACVIWVHTLLQLNCFRKHKVHTMVFLIFCVANVGGVFSSLGDPPLLLGFLKGIPFFWATQHLTPAGVYVSVCLLGVYYLLDTHMYRKESFKTDFIPLSISVTGRGYIAAVGLLMMTIILIQKYSTQMWSCFTETLPLYSGDIYKTILLSGILYGIVRKKKELPRFSSHVLKELSWTFLGLFMCVVPVVQWLHEPGMHPWLQTQGSPKLLFWISGICSAFLDNAPTYVLFVESAGGFKEISSVALKHISCATVMMGAMTYIGNAPNLLVKSIAENQGISMPNYFSYMKWSLIILLPILIILVHGTAFLRY
ncbi:sodium:proton antiporter [Holospora curviuscula]|uniref:Citrate transporter n=1 Tax=Holospora curviuscula TaxID=1082868 RepID=A0A2S5RAC6_9PROT|nr:sodium:proton antiporter [Holospora curviuscula]PPE04286.1 hypothetical protein HCUR_00477 [Holospora curviuscula]